VTVGDGGLVNTGGWNATVSYTFHMHVLYILWYYILDLVVLFSVTLFLVHVCQDFAT